MPSTIRRRGKAAKKVSRPVSHRQHPADELQEIPGIGPSMALDLHQLGVHRVSQLRGRDPEKLYRRLIALRGQHQDRCVLYVFRCAVYYASTSRPKPERLQWWWWKDRA